MGFTQPRNRSQVETSIRILQLVNEDRFDKVWLSKFHLPSRDSVGPGGDPLREAGGEGRERGGHRRRALEGVRPGGGRGDAWIRKEDRADDGGEERIVDKAELNIVAQWDSNTRRQLDYIKTTINCKIVTSFVWRANNLTP